MNKIASWIKELREERGLNKSQLAKALGLSHVTVVDLESGKKILSLAALISLAKFFNTSANFILGLKDY